MKKPKVLLVDDEVDLVKAMEKALTKIGGFNVITANSADDGYALLLKEKPDVVISDVRMPGRDGISFLKQIKELDPTTPVVFLVTGFAEITKEDALAKGVYDMLEKPLDIRVMIDLINKALKK